MPDPRGLQERFQAAVQAEEAGEKNRAIALYQEILSIDPQYAAACINLGTLYFHLRQFGRAEELYRRATVADPGYVLAYFDLGNVLDELERIDESIAAYLKAVTLSPRYADAHYNLAPGLRAHRRAAQRSAPLARLRQARQPRSLGRPRTRADSQAARPRRNHHCRPRRPLHRAAQGQSRAGAGLADSQANHANSSTAKPACPVLDDFRPSRSYTRAMKNMALVLLLGLVGVPGAVSQQQDSPFIEGYVTRVTAGSDFDVNDFVFCAELKLRTSSTSPLAMT
ncbi:MAG: tetratricopeptide repeat protein [Terracidiphilus sp.]